MFSINTNKWRKLAKSSTCPKWALSANFEDLLRNKFRPSWNLISALVLNSAFYWRFKCIWPLKQNDPMKSAMLINPEFVSHPVPSNLLSTTSLAFQPQFLYMHTFTWSSSLVEVGWCDRTSSYGSWWLGVEVGRSTFGKSSFRSCIWKREPWEMVRWYHHGDGGQDVR